MDLVKWKCVFTCVFLVNCKVLTVLELLDISELIESDRK